MEEESTAAAATMGITHRFRLRLEEVEAAELEEEGAGRPQEVVVVAITARLLLTCPLVAVTATTSEDAKRPKHS